MKINIDINLLEELTADSKPLWGKMTAQHMIEHVCAAVKGSNGKITFKDCMNPPEKYPLLKRFLIGNRELPKNFVNTVIGEGLKPLQNKNFEEAKRELIEEVDCFYNFFNDAESLRVMNPTFGPLNYEEWIVFHTKHFTHHFSQFGLMGESNIS